MNRLQLRVGMFFAYYRDLIFRDKTWAINAYRARLHGMNWKP